MKEKDEKARKKKKIGSIKITIVIPSKKEMRGRQKAREKENRE